MFIGWGVFVGVWLGWGLFFVLFGWRCIKVFGVQFIVVYVVVEWVFVIGIYFVNIYD